MTMDAAAMPGAGDKMRNGRTGEHGREARAIAMVCSAHFVQHFQTLVLPPLFPFLKAQLGIGFIELGFALTVANIVSVVAQLPVGFLVDRVGSRRMLVLGLMVSAVAFISLGLSPSYTHLLLAMAAVGLSSSVFHPADYAILSALIPSARVGRAFSIHTFAGFVGNAVAPITLLPIAAAFGLNVAFLAVGGVALAVALPLIVIRGIDNRSPVGQTKENAAPKLGLTAILTPTMVFLMGFFALLSLSGSGISNFSVVALHGAFNTPLAMASLALTIYLSMQALGVLAGGFIADKTRRHAEVAAIGYAVNACIVLAIGTLGLGAAGAHRGDGQRGIIGRAHHAVARHAGACRGAAGCDGPRLWRCDDGAQCGRHGRAAAVRLHHGSQRTALGVRRQRHRDDHGRHCRAHRRSPRGTTASPGYGCCRIALFLLRQRR
jgi:FSR family fosmidomycin resistance protein-like MFS transporter